MDTTLFYNLTNPQKSIWDTEKFYEGTNINNICGILYIQEKVNLDILEKAINICIQNNPSFSIKLTEKNGEIKQSFFTVPYIKFERLKFKDKAEVEEEAKKIISKTFDVKNNFLFEFKSYETEDHLGGAILVMHHLIADAATFAIICKSIIENYNKLKNNEEPICEKYSYEEYIKEEQEYLKSDKFENDKKYWEDVYETIPDIASINGTTTTSEDIKDETKALREEFKIDIDVWAKIQNFCKEHKISDYNFFMAIYAIYLGRVSNLDDFVIGTPILNRANFAQKHTTGMFINTAPLRIKIEDDISFINFAKKIAQSSFSLLKHQKYPYQKLLEDLRKKDNDIPALYDFMLSYQITKANDRSSEIPYSIKWIAANHITNGMYVNLHDNNDDGGITFAYDYQVKKYIKQDIIDMHKRILHIIGQVLENEEILEKNIEIVTEEEKHQILYEFNNTETEYPRDKTIVDLFEEQVEKTPDNVAVVFEDKELTFRELNERANSLAHYLREEEKITRNDLVGIMISRSLEMIVAILGVLKAGGAYIPIDPSYPKDRIDYMLESSNSKVLLTLDKLKDNVSYENKVIIDLEENEKYIYKNSMENLEKINEPEDLAYVIFTSGSTGKPKGVMLKQKNIVNFIYGMKKELKFTQKDTIACITTISFDIFVLESLMPLLNGLKIVIANEQEQINTKLFNELCKKQKVNIIQMTPSRLQTFMIDEENLEFIKKATHILVGGEPFPPVLLSNIKKISNAKIYNMYGPTETAVWSSMSELRDEEEITIGKPIANTQIYILDKNLKPAPAGVQGEIYISGDGVSRGYLNNKELTEKSFIENPFIPKSIMYKTGDMGKYTKNGKIICLGRMDNQVKIRGLRIELEEIETLIFKYPGIKKVCVSKQEQHNRAFIAAYFIADEKIDVSDLQKYLSKQLPRYMVPTYFVELDDFPYTPNGKIDKKKLPEPKFEKIEKKIILPRNEVDKKLVKALKEILNIDEISLEDDFFELGGDSLSAITLCAKIQSEFNVNILVKDILANTQIQELSNEISEKIAKGEYEERTIRISPIEKAEYYETSSAQKRIYYTSKMAGEDSILYNISGGVIINTKVDKKRLKEALNELVKRHESLRTYFEAEEEVVVQKIENEIKIELDTKEKADFRKKEEIFKEFVKPFDLTKAPLFRIELVEFTNGKSALLIDMHHIISDGTSLGIFTDELCKIYNGEQLENKELTYKDYAHYESEQIKNEKLKEAERYWIEQFTDEIPVLNIPTNYPRPAIQDYKGKKIHNKIKNKQKEKLEKLCKELGITPYMLLLSCYYILLSKYTSQEDIVVGSPIVGRDIEETYNVIGMFVNTLALREKIESDKTVKELIEKVKEKMQYAYKYQTYPFDELVNKLNIQRDASRSPIFDTMFIYQNKGYQEIVLDGEKAEYYIPDLNISKFDLSLEIVPEQDEMKLNFEYATSLFEEEFIENLSNHYINIINNVVENVDAKISEIEMLSEEEKNKILYEFNNTDTEYPREKTIVDLFEEQVEKTPDNIAVVFEDKKLTYRELNERANSLATYLRKENIEKNSTIGIFLDKSIESIIAIIAILKSNCVYMPIDIEYPSQRIEYMIKDSNTKYILTLSNLEKRLNDIIDVKCVNMDNNEKYIAKRQNNNNDIAYNDMAYVMYTSGSTGNPKGVMVSHQNVVRLVKNTNYINFEKNERILQTGSIVFDACTFEIWGALLNGFELYIIKKEELLDPNLLKKYIAKNNITIVWLTASLFNQMSEYDPEIFKPARILLTGGDVLSPKHINKVKKACPNLTIINGYGPTENTTFTTCFTIKEEYKNNIPVGYPISNTTCYVVSKTGQLMPIGVVGELWVGGDGVSKGYLNNPEKTQESFIDNIYGSGKLYKTGDYVKWRKDGSIDFIGRIDNQIKIRGFRIELNEINIAMLKNEKIKEVYTITKDIHGEKNICTYFSASEEINIDILKKELQKVLPAYAIPMYFVQIKEFPINTSGKIDRKKLPEPIYENVKREIVLPRNSIDERLINLLKGILKTDYVSMDDYFFELGGDSLSAITLCAKIQSEFNVNILVKDILANTQIQELSNEISEKIAKGEYEERTIRISPIEKAEYYETSSAQKRIYYTSKMAGEDSILYNISGGVIINTKVDKKRLKEALNELVKRHESLRTYFEAEEEVVVQKIENEIKIELDTKEKADFRKKEEIFKEFVKPFDLTKAPLFRIELVEFTNGKSALLIDMHHIISDGTSLGIFTDELCKIYNGEQLENKELTYKDYAHYESEQIKNEKLKEAERYWIEQFTDEIPVLNIPTNYPRPAIQDYKGKKIHNKIKNKQKEKLEKLCKELGITPYMLLLSCYYILLSKYTSQEDIVVGSPIVGRDIEETYNVIGMFVNTLALREKIESDKTVKELIEKVKEKMQYAYKYQTYPFDELVNKLNIQRDASRSPIFDTMFIYQNKGYQEIVLDGEKAEYYIPDLNISKFDLSLEIVPEQDEMKLNFEYATSLFEEEFIENLSNHYINIINNVVENVDAKISEIEMLSEEEKNKILYEFNNTDTEYPREKTIVDLFEEQVEKTPDNIAVVFEDKELTYRELNEKANSLAHYLREEEKITRDDLVGIMVSRSLEMIIAILGVLKAGGAYIPIDPSYPKDRIDYMLESSNSKVLLTLKKLENNVSYKNKVAIDLEENEKELYKEKTKNLENINKPEDLAYVIFTSGSTGKPKGVMLRHKALSNLANYCNNYVEYLKDRKYRAIVSITTISFDIFIFETIISLQKGLKLIIADENEQNTPTLLNDLIKRNNIEIIQSTPSRMQVLVDNKMDMPNLKNLKYIILAGEQLPLVLLEELHAISNNIVYNGYGPSETTVFSTLTQMEEEVNIGKPLNNTQIYILNNQLKPLPIGVQGEIYISGDGVGRGYLNNKELTEKSFIENPFIPNSVMYKTGDIGKYDKNGNIVCLGRIDNQVKIRGLRIELEEIEILMSKYPNIKRACAVKQELNGREFITVYFVTEKRIVIDSIRKYLSKKIPKYMMPTYFFAIDDFKYTPNGKIDKKALPLSKEMFNIGRKKYIAPSSHLQKQIVNVWENLLNIKPIGIDDNFFELGGDSLLAMNLHLDMMKISNKIKYADIFNYPTVRELEEQIRNDVDKLYFNKIENLSGDFVDILNNATKKARMKKNNFKNVLLTGVTGYLGIHILEELIKSEKGNIYCILRNDPGINAETKLYQKLNYYFKNKYNNLVGKRIFVLVGDISKKDFGLKQEEIEGIVDNIDIVINSAANVAHFGNYDSFYKTNVKSVKYMVDFCQKYKKKFYQISTMSVAGNRLDKLYPMNQDSKKIKFNESDLYIGQTLENVYARSKFEAEVEVLKSISQNLDGYILRIGNLMPRFRDGIFQDNVLSNAFVKEILSLAKVGAIPEYILDKKFEMTPADDAAKAIYKLIKYSNNTNRIFHVYNNNYISIRKMLKKAKKLNNKIMVLPEEEFKKKIENILNSDSYEMLNDILHDFDKNLHLNYDFEIKVNSRFTNKYLARTGFKWHKITNIYLTKFIKLLRREI